jgi:RNA-directed DNA polymerase
MPPIKTTEIKTVKHLLAVLNCSLPEIEELIAKKQSYYYIKNKPKEDNKGNIRYDAEGKVMYRILNPSKGRLKQIQSVISDRILSKIPLPPNIKGGVKGSDNVANARVHLGKKYKFKTDMKRYFPSINHDRVFRMLLQNGFSSKVASLLTHLTTHKYELPQGTPTSMYIANLVFLPNDIPIIEYCRNNTITYSRYVDDLVFSSPFDFRARCNDLINFILRDGFKISYKKTVYKAGNMEITGIYTMQNVLDVTEAFKDLLSDPTIKATKTAGREKYYKKVRKK